MQLTCPRCCRFIEFEGERPSFCGYCGHHLSEKPSQATVDFDAAATPAPEARAASALEPVPEVIGGYRLLRALGSGGMGTVHEAEEIASGRRVALKLIARDVDTSNATLDRFRQEGRLASLIAHPRCVFVLAADEEAGQPYIVMELMPGATLQDLVERQGPMPPEQAVARILDVIEGLQEAHRLGVIHRDVKPSNCFVASDGRVKVGDFGLSKSLSRGAHLTRTGAFVGTPLYASPEQIKAEPVDEQSDVYSVAATLYFLLTGRAPHETGDAAATLARIVSEPAPSLRRFRPEISAALDEVVLRGLERQRARRWRNLAELREALLPLVSGQMSIAGIGLRFAAYLLDALAILVLESILMIPTTELVREPVAQLWLASLRKIPVLLAYFGLLEGLWGWSLGKRLLGLRVRRASGTAVPGIPRALLRTLVFYLLLNTGSLLACAVLTPYWPLEATDYQRLLREHLGVWLAAAFLPTGWYLAGLALLLAPMRKGNGYRGLHEFLSGTRVVAYTGSRPRRLLGASGWEPVLSRPEGLPERVGSYLVQGGLRWDADAKIVLAEDATLHRKVWVRLRPLDGLPLDEARRKVNRMSRLWSLASGVQDQARWDAFAAPTGCPLSLLVAREGKLGWSDLRPILEELADELTQSCADGTLPATLSADQVWLEPNGRVQLLDVPLHAPGGGQAAGGTDHERSLSLLAELAVLALEGRAAAAVRAPRAPVPRYAALSLRRLSPGPGRYLTAEDFRKELASRRDQPGEVTRARRVGHLAVLAAFLLTGAVSMFSMGWVPGYWEVMNTHAYVRYGELALADLEAGSAREYGAGLKHHDPLVRQRAEAQRTADLEMGGRLQESLEELRQRHDAAIRTLTGNLQPYVLLAETEMREGIAKEHRVPDDVRQAAEWRLNYQNDRGFQEVQAYINGFFIAMIVVWPILWVCWSFATRGGLSFWLLGIALVRWDGEPASRLRCAWRAFVVWAPVTSLLVASYCLERWYWSAWRVDDPYHWVLWLAWASWWAALASLAIYAVLALWLPNRSLHDRLAGTYLVPR
jgi:hypothetical protein